MCNKLVLALAAAFFAGFGIVLKGADAPATKPPADLVARIHFVGMTQVAANPKAASFNALWQLPATQELLNETLAKLATAPYRILQSHFADHNDHADLIRALLRDLVNNESYVEVRGPTNAVPELLLAIKLDSKRADAWRTSIASMLSAWTAIPVKEIKAEGYAGWELRKHHDPNCIRFIQAGDWVVFGWGWNDILLQPAMLQRIKEKKRPVPAARDYTLDAWVDWPALTASHPTQLPLLPAHLPKMQLTITNAPDFVRTRMVLQFPKPLPVTLEPWQIPVDEVRNKIFSFTAVRGISSWLDQCAFLKNLSVGPVPGQWFVWAQDIPFETRMAVPVKNAKEYLRQLAPKLIPLVNSNLAKVFLATSCAADTNGDIHVSQFPFCTPYLRAGNDARHQYVFGGVMPSPDRTNAPPSGLFDQITSRKNLVYYDWEITEARVTQWRVLSQLALIVERKAITETNTPAQKWIDASKKSLGNCTTIATLTAPDELTVIRNSPVGFTGVELTGLAIWLDSKEFPFKPAFRPQFSDDPDQSGTPKTPR